MFGKIPDWKTMKEYFPLEQLTQGIIFHHKTCLPVLSSTQTQKAKIASASKTNLELNFNHPT